MITAPNSDFFDGFCSTKKKFNLAEKPPSLSMEGLQRAISDISLELMKEATADQMKLHEQVLPPISEVEKAECECCGMCEECTLEYINRVKEKFSGKLICGLCAEAVKAEMEKNGGKCHEALSEHTEACVRFNRIDRAFPVLCQAEAMREILKKSRGKSHSPRNVHDHKLVQVGHIKKGGIARSSSCIPAMNH